MKNWRNDQYDGGPTLIRVKISKDTRNRWAFDLNGLDFFYLWVGPTDNPQEPNPLYEARTKPSPNG